MIQYLGDLADLKEKYIKLHIKSEKQLPEVLPFDDIISSEVDGHFATATLRGTSETVISEFEKNYQAIVTVEHLNLEDIFLEMNQ